MLFALPLVAHGGSPSYGGSPGNGSTSPSPAPSCAPDKPPAILACCKKTQTSVTCEFDTKTGKLEMEQGLDDSIATDTHEVRPEDGSKHVCGQTVNVCQGAGLKVGSKVTATFYSNSGDSPDWFVSAFPKPVLVGGNLEVDTCCAKPHPERCSNPNAINGDCFVVTGVGADSPTSREPCSPSSASFYNDRNSHRKTRKFGECSTIKECKIKMASMRACFCEVKPACATTD